MDEKPFFEFNMLDIQEPTVMELKKFSKSSFELNTLLTTAEELKYMGEIRRILEEQMVNPSEDFVRFFTSQVYKGRITQQVKELFTRLTKNSYRQFINDKINARLKSALAEEEVQSIDTSQLPGVPPEPIESEEDGIVTTEEEITGYNLIKSVVGSAIDSNRVFIRDTHSYCGVIFDDNNRKPIARMYFNGPNKYLGLFDAEKKEEKVKIDTVNDINNYADKLKSVAMFYDAQSPESVEKKRVVFSFKGQQYEAWFWKDMYTQICDIMAREHRDRIGELLTLTGRKNLLFSKNPADLRSPAKIEGTDIYAEVSFSTGYLIKMAKKVIALFGYSEDDLVADYP